MCQLEPAWARDLVEVVAPEVKAEVGLVISMMSRGFHSWLAASRVVATLIDDDDGVRRTPLLMEYGTPLVKCLSPEM